MTRMLRLFYWGINQYQPIYCLKFLPSVGQTESLIFIGGGFYCPSNEIAQSFTTAILGEHSLTEFCSSLYSFLCLCIRIFFIHSPLSGTIHWTLNCQVNTDPKINLGFRLNVLRKYKLRPLFDISRGKNEKIIWRYLVRSK